ncbi:hypothetical protein [Fredinandcohnia onubensis]|uniref:hypothetical protein n=1 Tax=Fredinandcohnia onubensis TaxID=1571209 RepID=UPI000C0C0DE7|nr:hypothetical protein [Fredinandcohnia onubensis]
MGKNKIFTMVTLVVVLLVGMSACSKSSDDAASINKGSESNNLSKSTIDLSTDSTEKSNNNRINNSESSDSGDKIEEEKQSQKPNNPDNNTSTQNQAKLDSKSQNTDASPSNDVSGESTPKTESSEGKPIIVISSGEKAIQYLKQQLSEGKDDDVSFGVDETLATDDHGSYYTVQLVSVSTRVSGKTGTLGYYKVYQDGVYKTF